jgi:hypothetical protein
MVIYQKGEVEDSFKAGAPPLFSSFSHSRGAPSSFERSVLEGRDRTTLVLRTCAPYFTVPAEETLEFQLQTQKSPSLSGWAFCRIIAGDHLISHTVARAVPSAQRGLTSVFGMGTGDPSQYGHRQSDRG